MAHFIGVDPATGKPEVKGVEKAVKDDDLVKQDKMNPGGVDVVTKGSASG